MKPQLRSVSPEIVWPALPSNPALQLMGQLYQLSRSEWWGEAQLGAAQLEQLGPLLAHARAQSSFYGQRLADAGIGARPTWDDFARVPPLTRTELLTQAEAIHAQAVPKYHGDVRTVQTSGSTGQVVAVRRSQHSQLKLFAFGMRAHAWFERDFSGTLAVIRADSPLMDDDERSRELGWGQPVTLLYETGPGFALPITTPIDQQLAWLVRRSPSSLMTYPTNLAALLERCVEQGTTLPGLREVRTVGETVTPALRERCREVLGVPVVDGYSSQELGVIALECPVSGLYHVQSESVIVELLDAHGEPVPEGSEGRLVVTDLHNFATPLVRYDIGDRAVRGPRCPCGRGLPTLSRILGRERNLVTLPDGSRHWPLVGLHRYREIGGVLQYQVVQHSPNLLEVRLVVQGGALGALRERQFAAILAQALGYEFELQFRYFEGEIPRATNGKYEEFVSLVERA